MRPKVAHTRRRCVTGRDDANRPPKAAHRRTWRAFRGRVHAGMLTVAIRGPLADKMRELAESTGLSLAKLLKDAILVYGDRADAGYEPGTSLANWTARQRGNA